MSLPPASTRTLLRDTDGEAKVAALEAEAEAKRAEEEAAQKKLDEDNAARAEEEKNERVAAALAASLGQGDLESGYNVDDT